MKVFNLIGTIIGFFVSLASTSEIGDQMYQDLVYYANYAKLASCIYYNRLSEGFLQNGACDLEFCSKNLRNKKAKIIKINVVPQDQSGTGFLVLDNSNKEIIISFRGSTTWRDWQTDLSIGYSDYEPFNESPDFTKCGNGCKIHSGFYNQMKALTNDFWKLIEDLLSKYPDYKLVLIGHSLGGAFAEICGIEFKVRGFAPLIITYGTPRLFNKEMMTWVNTIFDVQQTENIIKKKGTVEYGLIRITHENDYVPELPLRMYHAGCELLITKRDLPHEIKHVKVIGAYKEELSKTVVFSTITDPLHGYEHRTYFITINKCLDDIEIVKPHESF